MSVRLNTLLIGLGILSCFGTGYAKPKPAAQPRPYTATKKASAKAAATKKAVVAPVATGTPKEFSDSQRSIMTLTPTKFGTIVNVKDASGESGHITLNRREALAVANMHPENKIGALHTIEHRTKDDNKQNVHVITSFLGAPEGMVVLTIVTHTDGATSRREFDMDSKQRQAFNETLRAMAR